VVLFMDLTSSCRMPKPLNNSARVGSLRCAKHSPLAKLISSREAKSVGGWPIFSESRFLTRLSHLPALFAGGWAPQEHDTNLFSPPRGPLRLDFDNRFRPRRIVNKTTPFPVLWPLHQSSLLPDCDACSAASRCVSLRSIRENRNSGPAKGAGDVSHAAFVT